MVAFALIRAQGICMVRGTSAQRAPHSSVMVLHNIFHYTKSYHYTISLITQHLWLHNIFDYTTSLITQHLWLHNIFDYTTSSALWSDPVGALRRRAEALCRRAPPQKRSETLCSHWHGTKTKMKDKRLRHRKIEWHQARYVGVVLEGEWSDMRFALHGTICTHTHTCRQIDNTKWVAQAHKLSLTLSQSVTISQWRTPTHRHCTRATHRLCTQALHARTGTLKYAGQQLANVKHEKHMVEVNNVQAGNGKASIIGNTGLQRQVL